MCSVATVTKSSGWDGGGGTSELKCARHRSASSGPAQYLQSINPLALLLSQDHPAPQVVGSLWAGVEDAKQRGVVGLEAARRRRFASDKAASTTQDGTATTSLPPWYHRLVHAACQPSSALERGEAGDGHLGREAGRTDSHSLGAGNGLEGLAEATDRDPQAPKPNPSRCPWHPLLTGSWPPRPACGEPADSYQPRAGSGHHGDGQRAIGEDAARQ